MKFVGTVLAAGLLASVMAHPQNLPQSEVQRRAGMSKRCEGSAAAFNEKRYAKRMAQKRSLEARSNSTVEIVTESPYYEVIQNDTCVLAPEITEGPYVWNRSEILRQDMTEDQTGVPLTLDVGLLDMATCEPLEGALVVFWHCNATGYYSSFTGRDPNTRFVELMQELGLDSFEVGVTDLHTDETTFLRGMWPTDSEGMMEMKTIFPGFYVERAIHIHVQVYTDWVLRSNGTVAAGNKVSTGQLYFDESLEEEIMALEPYVSHTEITRYTNSDDDYYSKGFDGGYNPVVSIVAADGENVENGMIGYITIGVDTTAIEGDQ